jgi:hypothetical protein
MSRTRPWTDPITGEEIWFDQKCQVATVRQLELLADYEGVELDDLLDEGLSSKQALFRIRLIADPSLIPEHVLERRRERLALAGKQPACRICALNGWECEGTITRHHFVPRWLMLMLENYQSYAARSVCTIPLCVKTHRDLHYRSPDGTDGPKSIVPYLRDHERAFAQKLLDELKEQIPTERWELLSGGDEGSYEGQLIKDYRAGLFASVENAYTLNEYGSLANVSSHTVATTAN